MNYFFYIYFCHLISLFVKLEFQNAKKASFVLMEFNSQIPVSLATFLLRFSCVFYEKTNNLKMFVFVQDNVFVLSVDKVSQRFR